MKRTITIGMMWAMIHSAQAIEPLPTEEGFRGYVAPGISVIRFQDNTLAGSSLLEIGNKRIDSLTEKAEAESAGTVSLDGEIGYMFLEPGVYVYLGNRLEDYLRLDNSSELGARVDLGSIGIFDAGLMFTPVATEVWEDPFLTGADRQETERTSTGGRVGLANLFGTAFEAHLSARAVDIDVERSGESLGLDEAERGLLDRSGKAVRAEVLYTWVIGGGHAIVPALSFGAYDADGEAMTRQGGAIQITHAYTAGRLRIISNFAFRQTKYDEENPVFDEKQDENEFIISVAGIYGQFMGVEKLALTTGLSYAERDSKITFYDSEAMAASMGVIYSF